MKITNVSVTRERGIVTATSNVHGYTFTHGEECGILHAAEHGPNGDTRPWGEKCDCFLSRVDITEINGVPIGSVRPRWWEKRWVIFWSGYVACGLASFISRMFLGAA